MTGLLTKREAAGYLGVSVRTLDRLRQQKLILALKIRRLVRFRVADLDEFLSQAAADRTAVA